MRRVWLVRPSALAVLRLMISSNLVADPGGSPAPAASESKTAGPPMMNAMVCHITEGELRIEQEGKTFTAKKDFVWTCNKDTKEQVFNDGNVVAIMRITDLKA